LVKKNRLTASVALSLGLVPALFGLAGCSDDQSTIAPSKEAGVRSRDERQKAFEFGGDLSKAVPQKGRGR
jgi:hypothetical protein